MITFLLVLATFFIAGFWPAMFVWAVCYAFTAVLFTFGRVPRKDYDS